MYTTRAFCRLDRAVYLDRCLYHYVLDRDGSIMNASRAERMFGDELPFWREHIACIRKMVSPKMADLAAYAFERNCFCSRQPCTRWWCDGMKSW